MLFTETSATSSPASSAPRTLSASELGQSGQQSVLEAPVMMEYMHVATRAALEAPKPASCQPHSTI